MAKRRGRGRPKGAKTVKLVAVKPRKGKASRMKFKAVYIAGEQFRYDWTESDVNEFIVAYKDLRGLGMRDYGVIMDLAKLFRRKPEEVAILIMDLGERGYIGPEGKGTKPQRFKLADCE